jgi:hypothetical protein
MFPAILTVKTSFYLHGSVHRFIYIYIYIYTPEMSNKMQHLYLDFIARSLYMFRALPYTSSGVQ